MIRLFLVICLFCACTQKKHAIIKPKMNYYDSIEIALIDSVKKRDLLIWNDSIKWNLYCIYGNDSASWGSKNKNLPNTPLAFLQLRLSYFSQKGNDTASFYYQFIYNDSIPVESYDKDRKPIASEVLVKISTNQIIGYGVDFLYSMDIDERCKHPLRTEIIDFIKSNKDKLNPWFKRQAIQKGIL